MMNIEELRDYCLSLPEVTEKMPWAEDKVFPGGLCFYIGGKWFCMTDTDDFRFVNLKLPPELNESLRSRYEAVRPGWHMNKRYWSTLYFGLDLSDECIKRLIRTAYDTVVATLPKRDRIRLQGE